MNCGYDLRGIESMQCPECGLPRSIAISVNDPQQYHLAHAALERENLLVRFSQPGGSLGHDWGGLASSPGWLWVSLKELDRVDQCLSEAGIASSIGARPIVDRSEPICPACSAELDPTGPEACPQCHAPFHWVEIEPGPMEGVCRKCGYDLSATTSDRCPECGSNTRIEPIEPQPPVNTAPLPQRHPRFLLARVIGVALAIAALLILIEVKQNMGPRFDITLPAVGLGLLIVIMCSGSLFRGAGEGNHRSHG